MWGRIMDKTAEQFIIDILKGQLGLTDSQIWLRYQNRSVPPTTGLYVVVGMNDSRPVSSQTYTENKPTRTPRLEAENFSFIATESNGLLSCETGDVYEEVEVQRVQTCDAIQIDIFSRDNAALLRRWEVTAALHSIQAQQTQEANFFKISRLPVNFLNTSGAEGGSNINRYTLTFNCFVWYQKDTVLPQDGGWFDDFKARVDDSKTITEEHGLIEFEIADEESIGQKLLQEDGGFLITEDNAFICITTPIYSGP